VVEYYSCFPFIIWRSTQSPLPPPPHPPQHSAKKFFSTRTPFFYSVYGQTSRTVRLWLCVGVCVCVCVCVRPPPVWLSEYRANMIMRVVSLAHLEPRDGLLSGQQHYHRCSHKETSPPRAAVVWRKLFSAQRVLTFYSRLRQNGFFCVVKQWPTCCWC